MDLNDMDLVPFPRLYYLVPSVTPLYTLADGNFPTRRSALLSQQLFCTHRLLWNSGYYIAHCPLYKCPLLTLSEEQSSVSLMLSTLFYAI